MQNEFTIKLNPTLDQERRIYLLQEQFASVCNEIYNHVQKNRCLNRVALHHLVYYEMRGRYPEMGSQIICNAIYAVCRSIRLLLGSLKSLSMGELNSVDLPNVSFSESSPVFLDRHTVNLKKDSLSIYSPGKRLHFGVEISQQQSMFFLRNKLKEIILIRDGKTFFLKFYFKVLDMDFIDDSYNNLIISNLIITPAVTSRLTSKFESLGEMNS